MVFSACLTDWAKDFGRRSPPPAVAAGGHEAFFAVIESAVVELAESLGIFRFGISLIPPKRHCGHVAAGGEIPTHHGIKGVSAVFRAAAFGFDLEGVGLGESQSPNRTIDGVAGHVAECSGSEGAILAPGEGMKIFVVRNFLGRPQPGIPI